MKRLTRVSRFNFHRKKGVVIKSPHYANELCVTTLIHWQITDALTGSDLLSMITMGKLQRRNIKETVSNMATILVVCAAALAPMRRDSRGGAAVTSAWRRRDKNLFEAPPDAAPLGFILSAPLDFAIKLVVTAAELAVDEALPAGLCLTEVSKPRRPRMMQMLQIRRIKLGIILTEITERVKGDEKKKKKM